MFRQGLNLEQLREINMLLVATVRGEAPLVEALRIASGGARGQKRRILQQMLTDLEEGSRLSEALQNQSAYFPDSYREVIQAGEQSGYLGAVLEGVARYLDQMLDLRRSLGLALLYPLLVLISSYFIFLVVGSFTVGAFLVHFQEFGMEIPFALQIPEWLFRHLNYWAWLPPLLLLISWISWMRGNSWEGVSGNSLGVMNLIPGFSSIVRTHRLANFTEVVGILLDRGVPYHEALRTAAHASGERRLLSLTQPHTHGLKPPERLPPFVHWLLNQAAESGNVRETVNNAAEMYRRRADMATVILKSTAPILFLVFIAGGSTALYVVTVFFPFLDIIDSAMKLT